MIWRRYNSFLSQSALLLAIRKNQQDMSFILEDLLEDDPGEGMENSSGASNACNEKIQEIDQETGKCSTLCLF